MADSMWVGDLSGVYVTGDVDAAYFQDLRDHRSDSILAGKV